VSILLAFVLISHLTHVVKNPQEATLDSHFLLMASNIGAQKARAMKSGTGAFDIDDFISKLVRYMGVQRGLQNEDQEGSDREDETAAGFDLDWAKVARKALAKSRRVPAMSFMFVSLDRKLIHPDFSEGWGPCQ
jgi:non-structural maintenance of chromosomes element 4